MSYTDWKDKTSDFKKIDVRGIKGNFFQGIKKHAINTEVGSGLEIVQSFDPIPLYDVMEGLGFEHHTEQVSENEFHAYFYRTESKEDSGDIPMRPAALTNMPLIDEELGKVAVQFWDLTWNDKKRHLPYEIRLLLSLFLNFSRGIRVSVISAPKSVRQRCSPHTRPSRIWSARAIAARRLPLCLWKNTERRIPM